MVEQSGANRHGHDNDGDDGGLFALHAQRFYTDWGTVSSRHANSKGKRESRGVATPHQHFVPVPPKTWPPIPVWPPWGNPWPPGWPLGSGGSPWPYPGGPLPQVIAAALLEQASRMPITGRKASRRQLQKMLDTHRARLFRSSAPGRKRPSRRRASPRGRQRKA